jgi:Uma2 family endonuclease
MSAATALKQPRVSLDDFDEMLADMPAEGRWELINGRVIKGMVGARSGHHRIIRRLDRALQNHFERTGRPCSTFTETFCLRVPELEINALPDLMVHCGPLPPDATSLHDPIVIVEVLSPGTAARDRFDKASEYRKLPSLQHYVLIERDRMQAESFNRAASGWTLPDPLIGPDDVLRLAAIDFTLTLAELYRNALP